MEEEISFIEIFSLLWKGKFVIITITLVVMITTALINIYITTPLYRVSAYINQGYLYHSAVLLNLNPDYIPGLNLAIGKNESLILEQVLSGHLDDIEGVLSATSLSQDKGFLVVTVEKHDPLVAAHLAKEVSKIILFDIINGMQNYLSTEIEILKRSIVFVEDKINEPYHGKEYWTYQMHIQPELIEQSLKKEQGNLIANLYMKQFYYQEIDNIIPYIEDLISTTPLPVEPFNKRWQLNAALTGLLGLIISSLIVIIRPYVSSQSNNRKNRLPRS